MRDVLILLIHLIVTVARLARTGGLRSVLAESLLVKHQLGILNRGRKRAPNLRATERFIAGLCTLFMNPARVLNQWRGSGADCADDRPASEHSPVFQFYSFVSR